jgi:hypothetical protein
MTGWALVVEQFRAATMDRSTTAAKEIRECIEGKIREHVDLTVNAAHKPTNGAHTIDVAAITSGT